MVFIFIFLPTMFLTMSLSVDIKMPYVHHRIPHIASDQKTHCLERKDNRLMTTSLIMNFTPHKQTIYQIEQCSDLLKTHGDCQMALFAGLEDYATRHSVCSELAIPI